MRQNRGSNPEAVSEPFEETNMFARRGKAYPVPNFSDFSIFVSASCREALELLIGDRALSTSGEVTRNEEDSSAHIRIGRKVGVVEEGLMKIDEALEVSAEQLLKALEVVGGDARAALMGIYHETRNLLPKKLQELVFDPSTCEEIPVRRTFPDQA